MRVGLTNTGRPVGEFVLPSVVFFQDLLLGCTVDPVIVKAVPVTILGRLQECIVVAGIEATAMDEHTMQLIHPGFRLVSIGGKIRGGIKLHREDMAVINLHHRQGIKIVFKPFQVKMQNWRETLKDDALLGVLKPVWRTRIILVLALQRLNLDVVSEAVIQSLVSPNVQLNIPEIFDTRGLVIDINARDISFGLSDEQVRQSLFSNGALHLLLQALHQLSRQLLDILLLKCLSRVPAKGGCQFGC